jgi:hypothetical protein
VRQVGHLQERKRRVCWDPTPSDTPSESDTELAVPLADDATEEYEEQGADCNVLVVSPKTTMEKTGYDVQNVSDGRTLLMLVWKKILLACLNRDKHCFVLSFYTFYL